MSNLVGGRVYVAPNGYLKVKIYPHGFVEPVGDVDQETGDRIQELSGMAKGMLLENATPYEVFELMGWKPEEMERGK